MTSDNKNMLLAIALSVIVLVGWNYFYAVPEAQRARQPGFAPVRGNDHAAA